MQALPFIVSHALRKQMITDMGSDIYTTFGPSLVGLLWQRFCGLGMPCGPIALTNPDGC